MLAFMKANIASQPLVFQDQHGVTSKPGCVIASPSYSGVTNQDYVHHWVRDAAMTAVEIAASLAPGNGVDQTLCDYVAFSAICQSNVDSDPDVGFFRACFNIDGTPRCWSDQKDGPALQSLAFVQAWPYLETNAKVTATKVAQRNLDETVSDRRTTSTSSGRGRTTRARRSSPAPPRCVSSRRSPPPTRSAFRSRRVSTRLWMD
jgi:glucoamylase